MWHRHPLAVLAQLAGNCPLFRNRFNLSLKFLILGVKMFTLCLKFLASRVGFLIALLPQVAVLLKVFESAFKQLKLILDLLAFRFPRIAARFEEHDQFSQRTSEFCTRHAESIPSMNL